jgi:hypothetical protein
MANKPHKLSSTQQRQVVLLLSAGFLPFELKKIFADEYGLELTLSHIQRHDPRTIHGRRLAKPLRDLFWKEHEKFIESLEQVGLSHRTARVALLQRLIDEAGQDGDRKSLLKALDQVRKEMIPLDYVDPDDDDSAEQPDDDGEGE